MVNALFWKIKLDFMSTLRYRFSIISDLFVMLVLFVFFLSSGTGSSYNEIYTNSNSRELLLVGYLMWTYSITAISSLTGAINKEAKNGTLQILFHSKYPIELILFGELISAQMIQSFVIFILSIIAHFIFAIHIHFSVDVLLPIILCILGMYGIGIFLAGMGIFFKRIGALILLIQLSLLFVTDTIPTAEGIKIISKFIPLTIANDVVRRIISHMSYRTELLNLISLSTIWIVIGILALRLFISRAKQKGNLFFY